MALTVTVRKVGDVSIVDINGKITLGENTGMLRDEVRSLLSMGAKNLVFDMAHVGYIDSSGLGELVSAYTTIANQGGSLKLLNLQSKARDLMQLTKLYTVFAVFEDETTAIESFGAGAKILKSESS
jgi:anti-sigma B factor antagonist